MLKMISVFAVLRWAAFLAPFAFGASTNGAPTNVAPTHKADLVGKSDQVLTPRQAERTTLIDEQVVFVPVHESEVGRGQGHTVLLETTVFRPKGPGPFALVVMNHGKAFKPPSQQERARYLALSREFVSRGYVVVLPMRQGFSKSGGRYHDQGCDVEKNARQQAHDVSATVAYFQKQPWIRAEQVIVAGQSHGGLVTMAYGAVAAPQVKLLLNFAGGLKFKTGKCQAQERHRLIETFAVFGRDTRVASVWFYGQNDSYFDPALVRQMHEAYLSAGGRATLVAYPAFGQDAHGMVEYSGGRSMWWPLVERELAKLGFPVRVLK